jgi:hypothetical protein
MAHDDAYAEWGADESEFGISEWSGGEKTAGRYRKRIDRDGRRRPSTPYPTKLPGFPKPPADISINLRQYLTNLSEALEVRLGRKGDPRDAAVTFRDLGDVVPVAGYYLGGRGGGNGSNPGGGGDPPAEPGVNDPEAPVNFRVVGALYNITAFWDAALYGGHGFTEIWRADAKFLEDGTEDPNNEPTLNDALEIGTALGTSFVDATGPGRVYYYWIRHVNRLGEKGPWAFPYPKGLQAETAPDVDLITELFDELLLESQVIKSLQDEIVLLVDADKGLQQQINQLSSIIGDGDGDTDLSVILEQLAEVEADVDGLKGQYTVKIQTSNQDGKYIAGFGLSVESPIAGPGTSTFAVAAQNFAIIEPTWYPNDPEGGDSLEPYIPFSVLTQDTVDEETGITIPKGVYIKEGFIQKATVVKLLAGEIIADYIRSNVLVETPRLFSSVINMGRIAKTGANGEELPIREWSVVDADERVGMFSVNEQGIMHAREAHLYEVTIYDESNNEIIFNVNGISGTYIKDATITTAKIETAAITTLLLDGDAVTIPRGVGGGEVEVSSGTSLLGSVNLSYVPVMEDVAGNLVDIRPRTVLVNAHASVYSGLAGTVGTLLLEIDGTVVEELTVSGMTTSKVMMFTYLDTPPESDASLVTRTYNLSLRKEVANGPGGSGAIRVARFGMTVMGGKR